MTIQQEKERERKITTNKQTKDLTNMKFPSGLNRHTRNRSRKFKQLLVRFKQGHVFGTQAYPRFYSITIPCVDQTHDIFQFYSENRTQPCWFSPSEISTIQFKITPTGAV
ncbi:hypothetical protein OIU77_014558, partial [Salix suchowensis]